MPPVKKRLAADTVILGQHGEIAAGDEIPANWVDLNGDTHDTDFVRLEQLGYVDGVDPADDE